VKDPVIDRKIIQFRDCRLGRKFSPKPMYFHMGFGGLRGFVVLTSGFASGIGLAEDFYQGH
jgi:hypothetical protein